MAIVFDITEEADLEAARALVASRLTPNAVVTTPKSDDDDEEEAPPTVNEEETSTRAAIDVEGTFEGTRFLVRLERTRLQRGGSRPFTEIVLAEDAGGATLELRGAHGLHLATDFATPFEATELADVTLVGAPKAVVADVARLLDAPLAELFAAGAEVITFEVGPYAERAGARDRGIRLACRGWPKDEASLDHLFALLRSTKTKIAEHGPKLARHREVIAHERALAFGAPSLPSAHATKRLVLIGVAFVAVGLVLAVLALIASSSSP